MKKYIIVIIFALFGPLLLKAQTMLDNSFGSSGKVMPQTFKGISNAIVLQSNGKIILGGIGQQNNTKGFLVARFNANGNLDATYGNSGLSITSIVGSKNPAIYSMTILSSGKLIAVGSANQNIALVRYKSTGLLDSTFGTNGIVITDLGKSEFASSLKVQSDGKILVSGISKESLQEIGSPMIIRYQANGNIDSTFGFQGSTVTNLGREAEMTSLSLQSNGKVIIGGIYSFLTQPQFLLLRYNTNGTLDTTFGVVGKSVFDYGTDADGAQLNGIAVLNDDKIIAVGSAGKYNSPSKMAITKFNANGSVDATFGTSGKVTTIVIDTTFQSSASGVTIQPNGKILVAGYALKDSTQNAGYFTVARYTSNGSLDLAFGNNGISTAAINGISQASSLILQSDGNLVVGGSTNVDTTKSNYFSLARYLTADSSSMFAKSVNNINVKTNTASIYPNPSNDFVTISGFNFKLQTTISLYNVQGSLINNRRINIGVTSYKMDIRSLARGAYIIKIENSNKIENFNFIKN